MLWKQTGSNPVFENEVLASVALTLVKSLSSVGRRVEAIDFHLTAKFGKSEVRTRKYWLRWRHCFGLLSPTSVTYQL